MSSRGRVLALRDGRSPGRGVAWAIRLNGCCRSGSSSPPGPPARGARDGPRTVKELGDLAKGFVGTLGLWVDLVRVPPSGTWERRRADRLALAEDWVGPIDATEAEGLEHLVRAYLRGSGRPPGRTSRRGPASASPSRSRGGAISTSSGIGTRAARELVDLPDAPLPDPTCRPRSGSCRTGTPISSSTRAGRGSCPRPTGRASSRRRTRSRSARTSSTASWPAPGRSATAGSSSTRSRS